MNENMHGGYRKNAGRPKDTGTYKEVTKPVRIPLSRLDEVYALIRNEVSVADNVIELPLFDSKVAAGIPTTADDTIDEMINLNDLLVHNPKDTFMVKAIGESMINAGINSGDLMVVDKKIEPKSGRVVIAAVDGELTVKRLLKTAAKTQLLPENPDFKPIDITEHSDAAIIGVVTNTIHPIN